MGDVTMTEAADEPTHSEADLATIGDLMMWHQMPHLPAHRLIQLNCKSWPVWNPSHKARITEARRLDDSRDWYFPIITKRWIPKPGELVPPERCWTWSGIWHESADQAHTERARTLPPMTYLRQDWRYASYILGPHMLGPHMLGSHVVASEGGLLVIWSPKNMMPRRRSPRLHKPVAETNVPDTSVPAWSTAYGSYHPEDVPFARSRILVCNPLTKEYRELPEAYSEKIGWLAWMTGFYHGLQISLVVDDEANSYQVILLLKDFMAVYKSTTKSWNWHRFQERRPWCRNFIPWVFQSGGASVGGRVYIADIRKNNQGLAGLAVPHPYAGFPASHPTPAGTLRLFDIDAEAGTWHLLQEYTLRKFHLPALNQYPECFKFDMAILNIVELVGCMGDLYAVVPARLYDVVTVGQKQTPLWKNEIHNFGTHRRLKRKNRRCFELIESSEVVKREVAVKYMPLAFYVMQLRAEDGVFVDGVDHGVLRIEVLGTQSPPQIEACRDNMAPKTKMYEKTDVSSSFGINWFTCQARGSVIWVAYEDYLLSYDVLSRKCTTQVIPIGEGDDSGTPVPGLAYRPSFHMKP